MARWSIQIQRYFGIPDAGGLVWVIYSTVLSMQIKVLSIYLMLGAKKKSQLLTSGLLVGFSEASRWALFEEGCWTRWAFGLYSKSRDVIQKGTKMMKIQSLAGSTLKRERERRRGSACILRGLIMGVKTLNIYQNYSSIFNTGLLCQQRNLNFWYA